MQHRIAALAGAALAGVLAAPANATVDIAPANSVTITLIRDDDAAPDALFALLARPADWWDSDHTWSGDAANMALEARAGGCWCEQTSDGAVSVEHGRVLNHDPRRRMLVMNAALGPLQTAAMAGRLIWQVDEREGGGSRVSWTYRLVLPAQGNAAADAQLPGLVERVLAQAIDRLVARSEASPQPTTAP